jgi:hypothetical protein
MESTLKEAKRNCLMCASYKRFKPRDDLREKCLGSLKRLYSAFLDEFNSLRKKDAPAELIQRAWENKTLCLDAISVCEVCNQEFDKVNRLLQKISLFEEGEAEQ